MNIYIEVYSITHPYVGIGEFCLNLGKQLAQRATELKEKYDINLTFIVPKGYEGTFGNDVNYVSFLGDVKFLSRLHGSCIDLLHLPHQYCRFKHFPNVKNTLMTIHDINFMYEKQGRKLEKYKKKFAKKLHLSNYICYISQFTKKDTESNFDVECVTRVIYNGVSKVPAESVTVTEEFKKKLPNKPFLFHISSLRPKKNVHLLIEMMAFLPDEYLVIAGDWSGKYGEDMQARIRELGLKNVTCLNNVSLSEKIWLYDNSKAFLFPSVCEGFGLPPIEAMYYGKPAFLSELTSLPEVGGEHAFYWHDLEPKKMATVVEDKLKDVKSHPEMVSQIKHSTDRFDWAKCADEYIKYYLDILHKREQAQSKKVIQITSAKQWGGGEQYVLDLTNRLKQDGKHVILACRPCMADIWKKTGSEIVLLNLRGMGDIISAWKLSRIMKTGTYVIHTHNFRDAMTAAVGRLLSANQCNIRLVVTRHLVKKGKNTILYRWLYRQIDSIVFVSKIAEHSFFSGCLKIDVSKTCVIYNSIPNNRIINEIDIRKEFQIYPQIRILLYHGRINKEKGIEVLLEALTYLKYQNYCLIIFGEGKASYLSNLEELIESYNIKEKVLFGGFRTEMASYIQQCYLGVVPSVIQESFSLSCLDYMAQGKCVITTNNGGQTEFIQSGKNGFLVSPNDARQLALLIDKLLYDEETCQTVGMNALHDFKEFFDYEHFFMKIKDIYGIL